MQNMVIALVFVGALHRGHVIGGFDHAQDTLIAALVAADQTGVLICKVKASGTEIGQLARIQNRLCQILGFFLGQGEDVKSQALRRFTAYARQTAELRDEFRDTG